MTTALRDRTRASRLKMPRPVVRVAVPSPLRRVFDYWAPGGQAPPGAGMRVTIPFGKTRRIGVVLGVAETSALDPSRLRPVIDVIDEDPCLPGASLALLEWAAGYYHHPIGEVIFGALPTLLRRGRPAKLQRMLRWRVTAAGHRAEPPSRAPRQAALLTFLRNCQEAVGAEMLAAQAPGWARAIRALQERGWVEAVDTPCLPGGDASRGMSLALSPAQQRAVDRITDGLGQFHSTVLEGVTGSGKTEVYLQAIQQVVAHGRQALLLIPEIGLTPQMVERFRRRFDFPVAVLHSGLNDSERLCAWLMAREGTAPVVIGTRSAVFVPLKHPGIILVDEEHDLSYKQQDGFRYSARDLAVVRAHQEAVPVVLGSATPSLESLHNLAGGRYQRIRLPERIQGRPHPALRIVDVRGRPLVAGCSPALLSAIAAALGKEQQTLLFLNRRGFAPATMCHDCGWVAHCQRCDAHLTFHRASNRLRCHHCGAERVMVDACPECGSKELRNLGSGTERLEAALADSFPHARVVRVDRDSTRRKGAMEAVINAVHAGETEILIGTQMLAKGHHFPNVTLVGVVDADGGLFSTDFRAAERLAQLIVQVAGRAGRGAQPGEVLIQTHHPEHPLLRALLEQGYARFAAEALDERRQASLPPYVCMALLRAEAPRREAAVAFLEEAAELVRDAAGDRVQVLGPVPAPMERRAGRSRAQLLMQATKRSSLHQMLDDWLPRLEDLRTARRVRWSLDVDPLEMA